MFLYQCDHQKNTQDRVKIKGSIDIRRLIEFRNDMMEVFKFENYLRVIYVSFQALY